MPSPAEEGVCAITSRYRIIIPARDVLKTKKIHCTLATVIHCIDLISERAKRASSVMFVFNRNFRYVRIYIYISESAVALSI